MSKRIKRLSALSLSLFSGYALLSLLGLRAENADILAKLSATPVAHADVPHGDGSGCNIGDAAVGACVAAGAEGSGGGGSSGSSGSCCCTM